MPDVLDGLRYIADSPPPEFGGFHPEAVQTAIWAIAEIERLRAINVGLINARAAAAEVLARVASKFPVTCCECVAVLRQMEAIQ